MYETTNLSRVPTHCSVIMREQKNNVKQASKPFVYDCIVICRLTLPHFAISNSNLQFILYQKSLLHRMFENLHNRFRRSISEKEKGYHELQYNEEELEPEKLISKPSGTAKRAFRMKNPLRSIFSKLWKTEQKAEEKWERIQFAIEEARKREMLEFPSSRK